MGQTPSTTPKETASTAMANPASVYCVKQGFRNEIRTDPNSRGQYGVCIFPDGTECEEWKFFRGECRASSLEPRATPTLEPRATPTLEPRVRYKPFTFYTPPALAPGQSLPFYPQTLNPNFNFLPRYSYSGLERSYINFP